MRYLYNIMMAVALAVVVTSCSITQGTVVPNTHYVYPNSNVTPLGSTSSQISKFGFFFPPTFKTKDLDKLYGDALSRHSGADLLLDCKVDSKNTSLVIFYFMKTTLAGTAAKMEVGKQDIGQGGFDKDGGAKNEGSSQGNQAQKTETQPANTFVPTVIPDDPNPASSFGVQLNYAIADMRGFGLGASGEFYLAKKVSLVPALNFYLAKTMKSGTVSNSFTQFSFNLDTHFYFGDSPAYGLAGVAYGSIKEKSFGESASELGVNIGAGFSPKTGSNLLPFVELKYYGALPIIDEVNEGHLMLTGGLRFSF